MKNLILGILFVSSTAVAAGDLKLSEKCKSSLKAKALKLETARLAADGEELVSALVSNVHFNYWPKQDTANVLVVLEDEADGRLAVYGAKVLKTDAAKCAIPIVRRDKSSCRYSVGNGPESLNEITGLKFVSGTDIKPTTKLTALQKEQITIMAGGNEDGLTIPELIKQTDDGELSTGTLTLPNGRNLTYLGAYGGDNPFGTFFKSGTAQVAGTNSDDSVCIR